MAVKPGGSKKTYKYQRWKKKKKARPIGAIVKQKESPISTRRIEKTLDTLETLDVSTHNGMQQARGLINKLITDLDEAKKSGQQDRVKNVLSGVRADTAIKKQWISHIKNRINL